VVAMRERGVREGLVERVVEVLRETKSRVRVKGEVGEGVWTTRGVRQGCPLSPMLFNLLLADLEEVMGKIKWGGIRVGEERVYSLTYADDMVLLAEEEGEMRSMLIRLERYLEKKGLELNEGKTKVLRFREGGGRLGKVNLVARVKIEKVKKLGKGEAGRAYKRKGSESGSGNGNGMGYRKEEIRKGLEEKDLVI